MSEQHQLSSSIFQVDRESEQVDVDKHFFTKDKVIITQNKPRKVVFGQMERQERSIYQIVSPYMSTLAKTTGNFAYEAGSIAYEYIKQGFWWFYDQLTNKVIPYTKQELPKLIFIISKKQQKQQNIISGQFCVLSMQEEDFLEIERKKRRQKQGPIQVLIPLGKQDKALIEQIKRNYEVSMNFPIDDDSESEIDRMSRTYYIPSERFEVIEDNVKSMVREKSRMIEVTGEKQLQFVNKKQQKQEIRDEIKQAKQQPHEQQKDTVDKEQPLQEIKKQHRQSGDWQQVQMSSVNQNKRKAILLPDACIFQYEQTDEMYPFLLDQLENDDSVVTGHLINPAKLQKKQSKDSQGSGQVPLLTVDKIGEKIIIAKQEQIESAQSKKFEKVVDMERRVRPDLNLMTQKVSEKRQERELLLN